MSNWLTSHKDYDMFGECSRDNGDGGDAAAPFWYVINIPPPVSGSRLPGSAADITSITIPCMRRLPDTTGRMVVWFKVVVSTACHQWSVLKRFSEFLRFFSSLKETGLLRLAKRMGKHVVTPPSKFSLVRHRRQRLEKFLAMLQRTLNDLSVIAIANRSGKGLDDEAESLAQRIVVVTRSSFAIFIHFLTMSSCSRLVEIEEELEKRDAVDGSSFVLGASRDSQSFQNAAGNEQTHLPPTRIVHVPGRLFVIMLQLPGVLTSTVFVQSGIFADIPRGVLISGSWNSNITGPHSLRDEALKSDHSDLFTGSGSVTDVSSCAENTNIFFEPFSFLVDTFPAGGFEIKFEVPLPFAIDTWTAEHINGVLFVTWQYNS